MPDRPYSSLEAILIFLALDNWRFEFVGGKEGCTLMCHPPRPHVPPQEPTIWFYGETIDAVCKQAAAHFFRPESAER
jgi:hypothetical protein